MSDVDSPMGPRVPRPRKGLAAAGGLALAAAGALAGTAFAQTPGEAVVPVIEAAQLRPGVDLSEELRRAPLSTDTSILGAGAAPYEPFSLGFEVGTDRPDDVGPPSPQDESEPDEPVEPALDLFEGPDGRPAGPRNLAASPELPGGAVQNLPASIPAPEATDRNGSQRQAGDDDPGGSRERGGPVDPLLAARNGGLPERDLASPAAPLGGPRIDTILGRQNLPVTALRGAIPIAENDPFAPVGSRIGTFILYSALEQSVGAASNLSGSAGGKSGLFSETELSARLLSDWSSHEFEMNGLAAYRRNFAGELAAEPRLALDGRLGLDVDRLTTATLRGAIEYRQEDPIDLDPTDSLTDRPEILTSSAGAGIERQFGRARLGLDATLVREDRSRPRASAGPVLDDSFTIYTAELRAGYAVSPALQPFVAGSLGRRRFDETTDLSGIPRDSTIQSLRTGVEFDLGEKFLGEIAVGYAWNVPDASALDATGAPILDARLAWSPQRGTDIVLTAGTSFDPDTDGSGASTLYEGALALRHRLTHRAELGGTVSLAYRDSDLASEIETSYAAEADITYWLNRTLAFTGLLRHESLDGNAPGSDYTADTAKIGLRLQR